MSSAKADMEHRSLRCHSSTSSRRFNNVMFGPWNKIAEPYGKMVLGYFGKTPVPPDAEVVKLAQEQLELEPTDRPVLELNDADPTKGIEAARKVLEAEGLPTTDENIFIAAACKEKGIRFLKGDAEIGVRKIDKEAEAAAALPAKSSKKGPAEYTVTVNGEEVFMAFEGNMVTVDGKVYRVEIQPESGSKSGGDDSPAGDGKITEVSSQMPGAVYKQLVSVGDQVRQGEAMLVLEAMKMEMEISSPVDGKVDEIRFAVGDHVTTGQVLATIRS